MTYEKSISWLFSQFPAYQNVGISAYKPDLNNVIELCNHFNVNFSTLKFIHIAGTNGKGSTSNYLASILQESGFKIGLFTSPHILDFRERIRINGKMISKSKVTNFCKLIQKSSFNIKPSFFEITWVLALISFLNEKCDFCVIETGLGGRLDATNIINPILSIITSIGLDHTAILGKTLKEIAYEKAGIIKPNVPVILGEMDSISKEIMIEKAILIKSKLFTFDSYYNEQTYFPNESFLAKNELIVRKAIEVIKDVKIENLKKNALKSISKLNIEMGLKNVYKNTGFFGRFQYISTKPKIIIDAAHNVDGIIALMKLINTIKHSNLIVIYGTSNDKNVEEIIPLFNPNSILLLTRFNNQRSLKFDELISLKNNIKNKTIVFNSISESYEYAKSIQKEDDILLLTGSFFLLSDFFGFFSKKDL
jgi:dihydrofolate synthase/folylpolyglutamate synthase